jgi:hypothetical protein
MKFLDLINEDEQSKYDRVYKKTLTIFKTLKKGKIRSKSGVVFSYELSDDTKVNVAGGHNEDPLGYVIAPSVKIKMGSLECFYISYSKFGELIKKRFTNFGIHFTYNIYPEDIEKYEGFGSINEAIDWQDENSTNLTEDQLKQLKRSKTVFKALKKGKATFNLASSFDESDEHTVKYELGEPYYYWIYVSGTNTFRIEISKITVYIDDDKFYERAISKEIIKGNHKTMEWILLHNVIAPRVRKRFGNNDIDIRIADADLNFVYDESQLINEDEEREIKKVKAVFKAFKFKLFRRLDDYSYYFQLPDHVKILKNEPGIDEYRSSRRQDEDKLYVQVGHDGENNSVKFFKKKDDEDKMIKMDSDAGQYIHRTSYVNEKLKPFNIKVVYKGRNGKWD